MTEKRRLAAAKRLRSLLDRGTQRKIAFLTVLTELKNAGLPGSQATLYVWCKQFGISTK